MSLRIPFNTGSSTPIYKTIPNEVHLAVVSGKLAVGDRLASVCALVEQLVSAAQAQCSSTTCARWCGKEFMRLCRTLCGMRAGFLGGALPLLAACASAAGPITAPLRPLPANPNYFTDGSGRAVYLTGSHTWNDLQDWGTGGSPVPLDFSAFVNMLVAHNHNFTLLWTTELPVFRGLPTTASAPPDFTVSPFPWLRTGPGNASDGKLKFDLTQFNPDYFDRLRGRVQQLQAANIYAGVYLFSGEWLNTYRFPDDGYPLTLSNNINGIDAGSGTAAVTMTATNVLTAIQDAYVEKVIDTLNDLPNVLWIVSEEAPSDSAWWNSHLIDLIRSYEAAQPLQHPIGYAVRADYDDASIIDSDAHWIAPGAKISPAAACGIGNPSCKVSINDSDHSYFGMWNDSKQANRNFFWINFTQGAQTVFMDPYVVYYPREGRNLPSSVTNGIGAAPDLRWENVRATMGYIREYAECMNLAAMTPQGDLSSTGCALANTNPANAELLVYDPDGGGFTVNLSDQSGPFAVEWMNPATGVKTAATPVSGGVARAFNPPFAGDAVLYLSVSALQPRLSVTHAGTNMVISWPALFSNVVLQSSPGLPSPAWADDPNPVVVSGTNNTVTVAPTNDAMFYRLGP